MKIKILESAMNDLMDGYRFYEVQDNGLGDGQKGFVKVQEDFINVEKIRFMHTKRSP